METKEKNNKNSTPSTGESFLPSLLTTINDLSNNIVTLTNTIKALTQPIQPNQDNELECSLLLNNHITTYPINYDIKPRLNITENICLLKDDNGTITSDYGFTYEILSKILQSGEYDDYIKDGDWIELTTKDGATYTLYANIDTYYGVEISNGLTLGHHIDFISKELIYGSTNTLDNTLLHNEPNLYTWHMNNRCENGEFDTNNGIEKEYSPFLSNSSSLFHNNDETEESGIIDRLNEYFETNFNSKIKPYIVRKYHEIPIRYASKEIIDYDDGNEYALLPYLWIPYYKEITGINNSKYESNMRQYNSFKNIKDFRSKRDYKNPNSTAIWWTASASNYSIDEYRVIINEIIDLNANANSTNIGVPLCFRFI